MSETSIGNSGVKTLLCTVWLERTEDSFFPAMFPHQRRENLGENRSQEDKKRKRERMEPALQLRGPLPLVFRLKYSSHSTAQWYVPSSYLPVFSFLCFATRSLFLHSILPLLSLPVLSALQLFEGPTLLVRHLETRYTVLFHVPESKRAKKIVLKKGDKEIWHYDRQQKGIILVKKKIISNSLVIPSSHNEGI